MALQKTSAVVTQSAPDTILLSGGWTAHTVNHVEKQFKALNLSSLKQCVVDGSGLELLDTVGAWVLQRQFQHLQRKGVHIVFQHWSPRFQRLMSAVGKQIDINVLYPEKRSLLEKVGLGGEAVWQEAFALFSFVGEAALVLVKSIRYPKRWRWRPIFHNIQKSGFDALPLVGLTSFLLGIVVAYQGADQLKLYSANIFVVDLIGFSMLREFAPLITAILIAGRSGSAYAAQLGTMVVTDEIEALQTIGVEPMEVLVWPKILALAIALPLLTVFADIAGVGGGMIMARLQLDIGWHEFLDRFGKIIGLTAFLIGIGKAIVFAFVIAIIGCFQGFRTRGNADSVGRQTTRSVVQSIFIMIVADAIFSVAFSMLGL
ncbi:MAG: MlaE family lipid ABC transporter permease subunit [Pseudomonadota bacterium]